MKKYDPTIAAQRIVSPNVHLGLSRHNFPDLAKERITSVLTARAHTSALSGYARWLHKNVNGKHLKNSSAEDASKFLRDRALTCRQSTINLDRQAINFHLHYATPVAFVAAEVETILTNRAYNNKQIDLLVDAAEPDLASAILIATDGGLRDMELITISEPNVLSPSQRNWNPNRFAGWENDVQFVVHGKGGLRREVRLSKDSAVRMQPFALEQPQVVKHRGADLTSYFSLMSGQRFSIEFGKLSKSVLGFSNGSHGLRHSFAQRRRNELMCCGFSYDQAILILSQELGHFASKNTFAYLRD